MSQPSVATLTDLHLTISQVQAATPPTLLITLKNTNPTVPITFLTWQSPLDALLVQLGLVTITTPGSSSPLDLPTIMVRRRMPPPADNVVTLEPGQEVTRTVELGERFVSAEQWKGDGSGKAKVQVKGKWTAVWPGSRREEIVGTEKLKTLGHGDDEEWVLSGEYESDMLEIVV